MKAEYIPIFFFILSFVAFFKVQSTQSPDLITRENNRRILHQPFIPSTSSPPPPPPQSPPPPGQDQPFFRELPHGPVDPAQLSPPAPATTTTAVSNSVAKKESNSIKKVAIVICSAILGVGVVSALAFCLFKHRGKHRDESRKLVGSSQRNNDESRMPPSTFLYIGTVEPSATSIVNETTDAAASPYRKLNSGKRSSRYRPSPDLQPLPPLPKPPPPPSINSPPPMSSSDDEGTNFYTPQGSSMSNESPNSRHSYLNQNQNQNRIPHSKRTSPKSRLSASLAVIIPSIKPPSPPPPPTAALGPLQPSKLMSYTPKRAKFPPPPPPLDMARLRSITKEDPPPIPVPPPPPPPPPQLIEKGNPPPPPPRKVIKAVPKVKQSGIDEANKGSSSTERDGSKPKLKPLHWDKVRATSDRVTVWDQLNSNSFQLNEDAMESLFGCSSGNPASKEGSRKVQEMRVLDPKKSQNIAILLRALNVTKEEVSDALLDGNPEGLGGELLETLVKMAPTKEEEIKLKDYNGDISKLGSAERFLKAILDVPFAFRRVEAMLYRANFHTELAYLTNSFQTLEEASEELKNSRLFLKLLEAVLRTGNRMNDGTNRGDARAFKLDTLLKLVDIKGTDGKTTLLHFVVQEIIRSQGADSEANANSYKFKEEEFKKQGLEVVLGLSKELGSVKRAAAMDSDVLSSYVSKLEMGLQKVRSVMQQQHEMEGKFFDAMKEFLNEAVGEISRIKDEERKALSLVKQVTEYFHGDASKEEAHPFRIFVIVRDFLSILDNVCKDVGRMQVSATMGAGRSFRMPMT